MYNKPSFEMFSLNQLEQLLVAEACPIGTTFTCGPAHDYKLIY